MRPHRVEAALRVRVDVRADGCSRLPRAPSARDSESDPAGPLLGVPARASTWVVSDGFWPRVEGELPRVERRFRYPGRKRLDDRAALQGILFVLYTGIAWRHLPLELGFGSGSTCYRRMVEWQQAGVWERLHALLLAELQAAGEIEWSRAVADGSHVQAKKGAPRRARARLIEPETAPSTTSWSTRQGSRSAGRLRAATATTSPS
jgi:transposase